MRASPVGLALAFALFALRVAAAQAEPSAFTDACFVRTEPPRPASTPHVVPAASESRVGIRRKTGQLFDVELSVVGPDGALCSVSGVARLHPGEVLVLPLRPEGGKTAKPPATPCLVSLRATPQALEITTTEAACQAQSLCAGQVQLEGQRFDLATRLAPSDRNRCFAMSPP